MISAYPPNPQAGGSALLVFSGIPNVTVAWSLTGSGTLTPQGIATDARGVASALYTPGTAGDKPTVTCTHGTAP
ncbi:MAG: hypothetical protein KGM91_27965 [Burkholderiales bacterium]|nr:hypothetical protein [Burkholderiales bacterium]